MRAMARQDPRTKRIYDAAADHGVIAGRNPLTELTEVLQIDSPQRVKNWDTRGPSAEALLLVQEKTGINATWVQTGQGPEMVSGWPPGRRAAAEIVQGAQGTAAATPSVPAVLAQLARVLAGVPAGSRPLVADLLGSLAHAPDSPTLLDSIAAAVTSTDAPDDTSARTQRMLAMRIAEAITDPKERRVVDKFLGMLDTLTREERAAGGVAKATKTKG